MFKSIFQISQQAMAFYLVSTLYGWIFALVLFLAMYGIGALCRNDSKEVKSRLVLLFPAMFLLAYLGFFVSSIVGAWIAWGPLLAVIWTMTIVGGFALAVQESKALES